MRNLDSFGIDKLYCAHWITSKLCDFRTFKEYCAKKYADCLEGYLYLTESSILYLISSLEINIAEEDIAEMVVWGDLDKQKGLLKKFEKDKPIFFFIYLLNQHRKQLARIRLADKKEEKDINKALVDLKKTLRKISKNFFKDLEYQRRGQELEKLIIVQDIMLHLNYIDHGYPVGIVTRTMPSKIYWEYSLSNTKFKNLGKLLEGYAYGLAYLYSNLGVQKSIQKNLISSRKWITLHKKWVKVRDKFLLPMEKKKGVKLLDESIFTVNTKKGQKRQSKKLLQTKEDLFEVFRGRRIRVFPLEKNYYRTQRIMHDLFFGEMIQLSEQKVELIEFIENTPSPHLKSCTYAIYSPMSSLFWNASEWYVFLDICKASDSTYTNTFQYLTRGLAEKRKNRINFKKYRVEPKVFRTYLEKNDPDLKRRKKKDAVTSLLYGIAAELLAYEYFSRTLRGYKTIRWRVKSPFFKNTDCDVLAISDKSVKTVQVKTDNKRCNLEEIETHFKNIEKGIVSYLKAENFSAKLKFRKCVFFIKKTYDYGKIEEALRGEGIEVIFLEDHLSELDKETANKIIQIFAIKTRRIFLPDDAKEIELEL